jgi:hypothetical protein
MEGEFMGLQGGGAVRISGEGPLWDSFCENGREISTITVFDQ